MAIFTLNGFKTKGWCLSLLMWLAAVAPSSAVELRVAIQKSVNQIKIGSSTPATIKDANGNIIGKIDPMSAFTAEKNGKGINLAELNAAEVIVEPTEDGYVWIGDRWYRGSTQLVQQGDGITAINHVDLEDYLYSVVGAEAIASWPIEALKAQAVAARTYALYKLATSKNQLFDVDTSVKTQVYKGLDTEYLTTHEAVNSTAGQVITYQGQTILAVFHSSSGGHTENVEDVWSSPLPYLRGVVDYDQGAPVYQWSQSFTPAQLGSLIGVGNVVEIVPQKTTPRGRVKSVKVVGDRGSKVVKGTDLRHTLGLRSTLFVVNRQNGQFHFSGRGFGHGVGLSQWGAYFLAKQGINYQQILGHYYRNATVAQAE